MFFCIFVFFGTVLPNNVLEDQSGRYWMDDTMDCTAWMLPSNEKIQQLSSSSKRHDS